MTPQEKAKELVDIYKKQVSMTIKDYSLVCKVLDIDMAKQCALIAVDEILKVCENEISHCSDKTYFYWEEVKQEIQKL
jgi:hypothetical protein